ncbi:MAG: hypothetical protein OEY24_03195 [Candidatus Bathyarchaeota archaeon]|nr:hypothetical protein [Candidatus Bathyarchaeota archaeon]MDH5494692.1 hypothetical protein [Candidatus Bathyarchaeota archaeon]
MKRNKVKIEVFVPLGSCVCNFTPLMEKVGQVTTEFKDLVEIQMKSTKSSEASKYGVQDMCVVVDGKIKLSSDFDDKELEDAISERIHKLNIFLGKE